MQLRLPFILLALVLTSGCNTTTERRSHSNGDTNEVTMPGGKPVIRPVEGVNGRIVAVKNDFRFVIVDFANQRLPRLEQKLSVYRADLKVAEIKVSGPYRGTTVAADITAGDTQFGDVVRDR